MSIKNILCIGGNGVLGKSVIKALSPYNITNVDFGANSNAQKNLLLDVNLSPQKNNIQIAKKIQSEKQLYDAIVVSAGAWAAGSIEDVDYLEKYDRMISANLMPSLLAAHLACRVMNKEYSPLVIFTGAAAVFREPQPTMLGYSLSKTAVHSLAMNLHHKFIQQKVVTEIITILPQVIDTPSNRQGMPDADFSKWADPNKIGQMLRAWVDGYNRPANGSFLLLKSKNGAIQIDSV